MVNERFYKKLGPHKLSKIIEFLKDKIIPVSSDLNDIMIHDIRTIEQASSSDITFLSNVKYTEHLKATKAAVCIVPESFNSPASNSLMLLRAKNPYFAHACLINLFYQRLKAYPNKIMTSACIDDSAIIGKNCYIGHNVVIEANVQIGDNCIIESGSFIDQGVIIGNRASIGPSVAVSYSVIGDDVVILSGSRIGQDGFGFATEKGAHYKIFHTGLVIIGNDVEIGANTTIDRGSTNDTIIEDCCRIDNLVQIGHSVKIGKGSIIVAQVGIAGSTTIGKYCALAGQVGVAGHLKVGDQAQIAAQSGVMKDIEPEITVAGSPAVPIRDWHKQSIIMKRLVKTGLNKDK